MCGVHFENMFIAVFYFSILNTVISKANDGNYGFRNNDKLSCAKFCIVHELVPVGLFSVVRFWLSL